MSAGAAASSSSAGGARADSVPFFHAAAAFEGARPGAAFKLGHLGLGYYLDPNQTCLADLRPKLPERWRDAALREERLRVDPAAGAGLSLEHSDFGFAIESVDASPGQQLSTGEVIVAIEGRLLAGLSAPQMQASFQKRRQDGARLQVAVLAEVQELASRDPNVVECWDAANKHVYYFSKKTGRTSWTREGLQQQQQPAAEGAGAAAPGASKPPVDLTQFLSHGFAAPRAAPLKKRKAPPAASAAEGGKDESDLARDERQRYKAWNEGGRGGYTEQFFDKYKGCQSAPSKKKKDKRMEGSVGPGNGMEYMARWTGSKNSFN